MAGAVTSDRFVAGDRIGDYQIERAVGEDTISITYLATHVVLPRQAHLKIAHDSAHAQAVPLLREACILEAVAQPGHGQSGLPSAPPGLPRVYECGVLGDRRPWCAIERIAGVTFARLLEQGPVALPDLVVALRDVADVLRHVHERGVVHGGLTASAIVRTPRRRSSYAITEWGSARTLDADADVTGVTVDPRADVHALGAIAFRALTGRPPVPGASAATLCPGAPSELSAVIDQMLAEPVVRPSAADVCYRALWLCEVLQIGPLLERPRWTPAQGFVSEGLSTAEPDPDTGGFAIRIVGPRPG